MHLQADFERQCFLVTVAACLAAAGPGAVQFAAAVTAAERKVQNPAKRRLAELQVWAAPGIHWVRDRLSIL